MHAVKNNGMGEQNGLLSISKTTTYVFVLLLSIFIIYWQTVHTLILRWWSSPTYSHGLLVLPIVTYLIWDKREVLNSLSFRPIYWATFPLIVICIIWWVAKLIDVNTIQQTLIVPLIIAAILTAFGRNVLHAIIFPILYILTAIPIWNFMEPVLQDLTVYVVSMLLALSDIPYLVEQNYITIPGGKFLVAEVCAGLRFVMAASAITLLYGYINLRSNSNRSIFFAVGLIFSIILNWIRVYIVVIAGYISEMQHWLVNSHVGFGWLLFALSLIPLFAFGFWLMKNEDKGLLSNSDKGKSEVSAKEIKKNESYVPAVVVIFILLIPPVSASIIKQAANNLDINGITAPIGQNGWTGPVLANNWEIYYPGADAKTLVSYNNGQHAVKLLSLVYRTQNSDKEIINYKNRIYDEKSWMVIRNGLYKGLTDTYIEYELVSTDLKQKRLIWYWYDVAGKRITSRVEAKLMHAVDILKERKGSRLTAISYDYLEDIGMARVTLKKFIDQVNPSVMISEGN